MDRKQIEEWAKVPADSLANRTIELLLDWVFEEGGFRLAFDEVNGEWLASTESGEEVLFRMWDRNPFRAVLTVLQSLDKAEAETDETHDTPDEVRRLRASDLPGEREAGAAMAKRLRDAEPKPVENPSAFPSSIAFDPSTKDFHASYQWRGCEGMTLRDWFAGQALVGLLSQGKQWGPKAVSTEAGNMADAMLEERGKGAE